MHESQSRLWENIVGRSRGFWGHYLPICCSRHFHSCGEIERRGTFHRAINRVERSLIRTDADELTYNLHVMIRFDLELEMLEGRLAVRDLRDAWNERYRSDLGVVPERDGDGVLQDVHWYAGLIGGQFQGYAIGNVMSAQISCGGCGGRAGHSWTRSGKESSALPAAMARRQGSTATVASWRWTI